MKYVLYVGENCHQCKEVSDFLEKHKISFRKVNVDLEEEQPPIRLFAFPALFEGGELLKYGTDIIEFVQQKIL